MANLLEHAIDETLDESFGAGGSVFGGAPGGAGQFSHTQRGDRKTWAGGSPANRGMTGGPEGFNVQDVAQESEEFAKEAGSNKIYPLETINDSLVDAYVLLANAEGQLHSCVKYNAVLTSNQEKKALLDHAYKKVKVVREMIQSISKDIDRVTLS